MFIALNFVVSVKERFSFPMFAHFSRSNSIVRTVFFVPPQKVTTKCDQELYSFKDEKNSMISLFKKSVRTLLPSDTIKTDIGVDNVTLYEYTFSTLYHNEANNFFFPLFENRYNFENLKEHRKNAINDVFLHQYLMAAEFDENKADVCINNRNHTLSVVTSTRGCVFFQTDIVNVTEREPTVTLMMPTSMNDVVEAIKPFRNGLNFNAIFNSVFKKSNFRKDDQADKVDICTLSMSKMNGKFLRLVACVYTPGSGVTKFAKIKENDYLCPMSTTVYKYTQFNQPRLSQDDDPVSQDVIHFDKISFQEFCHSRVNVQISPKDAYSIQVKLIIESTYKDVPHTHMLNTPVSEIIDKTIEETCPFQKHPKQVKDAPQMYAFDINILSKYQFQVFILKTAEMVTSSLFEKCYYQREKKFRQTGGCTLYMPIVDQYVPRATGGLHYDGYKIVSEELNGASLILVEPRRECSDSRAQSKHLAVVFNCRAQWCDNPVSFNDRTVETMLSQKICASGHTGHSGGLKMNKDFYSLSCFFKISINNRKAPSYEFGPLKLENFNPPMALNWGNITFEDCIKTADITCITEKSVILCCCKAGRTEPPCNSRENALNKLATSQLRASVRCDTTLRLNKSDRRRCAKLASQPRLCISIFDVNKEEDKSKANATLARETCDLEVLHETDDIPLSFCHAHRTDLIESDNSTLTPEKNCYSMYFHDSNENVTPEEAEDRIISCCSPEYYQEEKEHLEKMKFKTIGSFLDGI
uniref:Proto-oncogene tyrosine-protein kinase receptor Ret n=1 Tax=Panagrellus redivivus TaxID=6233 RepID=A0A7E4UVS0_PANRE